MKNKLLYLIDVSLKRKLKTKWFIVANLILAILISGICNIDTIINFFGGDFNGKTTVHVIDNVNVYDLFVSQMELANQNLYGKEESSYIVDKVDISIDDAFDKLKEEKNNDIYLEFGFDENNYLIVTLLSKDYIDLIDYTVLNSAMTNTKASLIISSLGISQEDFANIYSPINIDRKYINEEKNNTDENMETIMSTVFPIITLPFFMLVIYLVQMVGAEVNDEKSTKGMEIIISNVSPKTHFFSKIIAGNLFVIIQGIFLVAYFLLGLLIRKFTVGLSFDSGMLSQVGNVINSIKQTSLFNNLGPIVIIILILMLLTFISYSLLAGILASMTTNTEDFQQVQTPIMIILLVGYYLSIMSGMFKGSMFIRIMSYIPLVSAILSPSLLVLGQITIIDYLISCIIVILLNYLLIKYGLKIYKVGILNYSSKDLWKKMYKAVKGNKNV